MSGPMDYHRRFSMEQIAELVVETDTLKRELDRRDRALEDTLTDRCAFVFVVGLLVGIAMAYWAALGVHP